MGRRPGGTWGLRVSGVRIEDASRDAPLPPREDAEPLGEDSIVVLALREGKTKLEETGAYSPKPGQGMQAAPVLDTKRPPTPGVDCYAVVTITQYRRYQLREPRLNHQ